MRLSPVRPGSARAGASRQGVAALAAGAALLSLAACGQLGLPTRDTLPKGDIGLAQLTQPPAPPEIGARSPDEIAEAVAATRPERLSALTGRAGSRRFEGSQLPFFFDSALGRDYLASGPGRALAFGEPPESCPIMGLALDRASAATAVRESLEQCLAAQTPRAADSACGCRVAAVGDALLVEADGFAYARAVAARLVAPSRGLDIAVIAEEAPKGDAPLDAEARDALIAGARELRLLAASGPVGAVRLTADGQARLTLAPGGAAYAGVWTAEGFRRGRLAKRVALTDARGRRLYLLIGYEPSEYAARRQALIAAAEALGEAPARTAAAPAARN